MNSLQAHEVLRNAVGRLRMCMRFEAEGAYVRGSRDSALFDTQLLQPEFLEKNCLPVATFR